MSESYQNSYDQVFDEDHLLYSLINTVPDLIFIKDTDSKFVLSNTKLACIHGFSSPRMMVGKTDYDMFPKAMADKFFRQEQELMKTGTPMIDIEEKGFDIEGKETTLSTTKIPLRNNKGKIIGLVGIGRDITVRKEAEEKLLDHAEQLRAVNSLLKESKDEIRKQSGKLLAQTQTLNEANHELNKLSTVARQTDNVVIILDGDGKFEWVNDSFTRIYGLSLDDFIKQRGDNILEASFNLDIGDIVKQCRESKATIRYQSSTVNTEGHTIWAQSSLTPVLDQDGEIVKFVGIDTDITALKNAQEMINLQKTELEIQRDLLEKLNITKDKFFSIIAHDLRNPFHSIMGFSDLLVKNFESTEAGQMKEFLGLINESAIYANDLLENLLQWSRTQSDNIKFSPQIIDIFDLMDEISHIFNAALKRKDIQLENRLKESCSCYADRNMVHAILRNLLSNSIKFTPEGGKIIFRVKKKQSFLFLTIEDNGVGIIKEDQEKLFNLDAFHTTRGTRDEQGTGLGLIICRDFVQKNGGEIHVESKPGKGSSFTFSLPLQDTES